MKKQGEVLLTTGASNDTGTDMKDMQEYSIMVLESMEVVNKMQEYSFMLVTVPVCLVTLFLNMTVLKVLWKKDKTIVNQLMKSELKVNLFLSVLGTFQLSPFYRGIDFEQYCYIHLILTHVFMTFNRLLPFAIAYYR